MSGSSNKLRIRTTVILVACFASGLGFADPAYERIELENFPGSTWSDAFDVNNAGWVVGRAESPASQLRAVVWQDGHMVDLGVDKDDIDNYLRINSSGQVIGQAWEDFVASPFLWRQGYLTILDSLGGLDSDIAEINNRGDIVGWSQDRNGMQHAAIWTDGSVVDLGVLVDSALRSIALQINNRGQVVVTAFEQSPLRGTLYLYRKGKVTELGSLGGGFAWATDINEKGQVVGSSVTSHGDTHAMLWQKGTMMDLGTLGGNWSRADAINNKGEVVGVSRTASGETRPFLWRNGRMFELKTLGGQFGHRVADINGRGQVVGTSTMPDGSRHAVLWWKGKITDLGPGAAMAISDSGIIAGTGPIPGGETAIMWCPAD